MKNDDYKYDVAFAFLKKDEHLANHINYLIQNKLSTYLYSKKHEDVADKVREKIFIEVFKNQSRSVVVFYRNKWGTTPWTRIEEKAIRNRALEEGFNFVLFIPLDDPPTTPKYLPNTRIWESLSQRGLNGAAIVIEELVWSLADQSRTKSLDNSAGNIKRDPQFEIERSKFLESVHGLEIAKLELKKLFSELGSLKNKIEKSNKNFLLDYQQMGNNCIVHYGGFSIKFYLQSGNSNPIIDSYLYFELQQQGNTANEPQVLAVDEYHFEVKKPGVYGWIKNADSDSFISSKKLAEESIKLILIQADNERDSKNV